MSRAWKFMVVGGVVVFVFAETVDPGDKWLKNIAAFVTVVGLPLTLSQAWQTVTGWLAGPPRGLAGAPPPQTGLVDRPVKLAEVVEALRRRQSGIAGIMTVELYGAGGFGKTALAQMACADPRVKKRFRGRVYWVEVGQDAQGPAAVAAKVIHKLSGKEEAFPDLATAGHKQRGRG
jgi:hypothetical protein